MKKEKTMENEHAVFLRTPYNYNTNQASDESGLHCKDESRTKQSFAEEVDINTIVDRFGLTYQMPENLHAPTYADFSEVVDFHTAANAIAKAHEAFDKLDPKVRARFNNNPGDFVDFCSDEGNRTEAEKLGLVMPKTPQMVSVGPVTTSNELAPGAAKAAQEPTPTKP